jgi:hypothetical protein
MADRNSFPLVRGRVMRVTALDGCGAWTPGPDQQAVSDGFVSIALTSNINEGDEIVVTAASGRTCVRDTPCPEFTGYTIEITFCDVNPCLYSLITGQPQVLDAAGAVAGFRMNSSVSACDQGFALEIWSNVPGEACEGGAGAFGYLLLPFVRSGVIGDFTIENAAVSFVISGAVTKSGNAWGVGPYQVVLNAGGTAPSVLPSAIDPDDHLYVVFTTVAPPLPTDGCITLAAAGPAATGATTGTPGTWTPTGSVPADSLAELQAGGVTASPTTAWVTGAYVQTLTEGVEGRAHWTGTAWAAGPA